MDHPDYHESQPPKVAPASLLPKPEPTDAPAPLAADPEDPSHALLHVPMHVRSVTLVVLTVLALLATLKWAAAFFIPVMIGESA
jgi:hypothetical protein